MLTRRALVGGTAAGLAALWAPIPSVRANSSVIIRAVKRQDDTLLRHPCHGDIFPMTWTADDRLFSSYSDGFGPGSSASHMYNTRGIWIDGDLRTAAFSEVESYPGYADQHYKSVAPYYGFSALAVGERLYHFLCGIQPDPRVPSGSSWNATKIIHSSDGGRTWCNQDGSTPVVWLAYPEQSRKTMLFFEEPKRTVGLVSLLQMGRGYADNRDGYVYGYGTNGNADGTMNQLVMFRVPKERVLDRSAFEFFESVNSRGRARWVADIRDRGIVHTFPPGWVNTLSKGVVQAWLPSVVYNAPLGLYLMASSGIGTPQGDWFEQSTPSYLGLWSAKAPWGPWTQIYEEKAWTPGGDAFARCYSPQICPKGIAPDGKSFWLVWSDLRPKEENLSINEGLKRFFAITDPIEKARYHGEHFPHYCFNAQRFDLSVG